MPASRPVLYTNSKPSMLRYICLALFAYYVLYVIGTYVTSWIEAARDPLTIYPQSAFTGYPWRTNQTVSVTPLLSNRWMRVESHTVRTESGKIMDDWIWMDVIDQVNVIPALAQGAHRGNSMLDWKFLVLKQHKYGIAGETLAVVGGHIESKRGETPLQAAQRELREEVKLEASPDDWILLGRYRTNANRGGGYCSTYLAKNARPIEGASLDSDDLEKMDQILLTNAELRHHLLSGSFGEIKWTATAALALLHLETSVPTHELSCILNCPDTREEQVIGEMTHTYNPYHQLLTQPGLNEAGQQEHDRFYQRMAQEAKLLQKHGVEKADPNGR